ncbi:MAG: toxin [Candidatus Helarchaeota archaeon]|nr:toxin [Candidatus Helarchaeota archaeon]
MANYSFSQRFQRTNSGRAYSVNRHEKNKQALTDLSLTSQNRDEIILLLELEDYCKGPLPDQLHSGEIYWEFGREINGIEVYIKLQIVTLGSGHDWAFCLSFHPAEHPLKFRFRPQN